VSAAQIVFVCQQEWLNPVKYMLSLFVIDSVMAMIAVCFCFMYALRIFTYSKILSAIFLMASQLTMLLLAALAFYIHFNSSVDTFHTGIIYIVFGLIQAFIAYMLYKRKTDKASIPNVHADLDEYRNK